MNIYVFNSNDRIDSLSAFGVSNSNDRINPLSAFAVISETQAHAEKIAAGYVGNSIRDYTVDHRKIYPGLMIGSFEYAVESISFEDGTSIAERTE